MAAVREAFPARTQNMKQRRAEIKRRTRETDIAVRLNLDGSGKSRVPQQAWPFWTTCWSLLSKHSLVDLTVRAKGDLRVDYHHTVEDLGLAAGDGAGPGAGRPEGIGRLRLVPDPHGRGARRRSRGPGRPALSRV